MKSRIPLLIALSILALGLTSLNAQETKPSTDSLTQYGLEPGKSYSAEVVAQLLDAAVAEGQVRIVRAFNDGYKAGAADFAPSSAYFESFSASISAEAKSKASAPTWGTVAIAGGGGLAVGIGIGFVGAAVFMAAIQ